MTSRIIDDPTAAGWSETAPGFWEFVGGGSAGTGIEEAPKDSKQYARQDAAWSEVVIPEGVEFVETDPTVPSHVKAITTTNISHWDTAWDEATEANGWGNHADAGYATMTWVSSNYQPKGDYLTDFTETDPVFTASPAAGITSSKISQWDTAYSWGSHSAAGYATEAWVNGKGYSTYTGGDAVKTSGNQTIGGAKTFSSNVTAPDFVATSDIAMKTNVQTAPVGMIDQIRGVEFDWRESGHSASGVIANEIEKVLPHLVSEHQGVKHVSYMGLIAYLIEEIKALKNGD